MIQICIIRWDAYFAAIKLPTSTWANFTFFRQKKKRQKKWLLPGKKWWTYPSGNFSELGSLAVYSISYSLHIHITKKWQKLPASMRRIYFILSRVMKKIQKKISFYQFPNVTLITDMNVIVKWVRILLCDSIFKNALFPAFSLIS